MTIPEAEEHDDHDQSSKRESDLFSALDTDIEVNEYKKQLRDRDLEILQLKQIISDRDLEIKTLKRINQDLSLKQ